MNHADQKLINTTRFFSAVAAALLLVALPSVSSAEAWELRTAPDTVPGTREIESGQIDKALRISEIQLPHTSQFKKVAVLTNLCIGYILSNDFEQAEDYCDRAVAQPNETAVSHNNRGILKMLQGDHGSAMQDFAIAVKTGCVGACSTSEAVRQDLPRSVARRNFKKAQTQVAEAGKNDSSETIAARSSQ